MLQRLLAQMLWRGGGGTVKLKFTVERKNKCKGEETKDELTSAIPTDLQHLNTI